jgi:cytochrome c peroxidase
MGVPGNSRFQDDELVQVTFRFLNGTADIPEAIRRDTRIDLGRYYVTGLQEDMGAFRTPTLRYLAWTAPYMHNGVFYTLEEVVEFYDGGGGRDAVEANLGHSTRTELLQPLGLTSQEKTDLVAFLESLSGDEIRPETPTLPLYGEAR